MCQCCFETPPATTAEMLPGVQEALVENPCASKDEMIEISELLWLDKVCEFTPFGVACVKTHVQHECGEWIAAWIADDT